MMQIQSTLRGPNGPVYPQVLKTGDVVLMLYDKASVAYVCDCDKPDELNFSHYRPSQVAMVKIDYIWDLKNV